MQSISVCALLLMCVHKCMQVAIDFTVVLKSFLGG